MTSFLAAAIQLRSTSDEETNLRTAHQLVERAARRGARFVATPEATNYLGPHDAKVKKAQNLEGPTCRAFSELAAKHGIHLLLGSFNERGPEVHRCYNTSVLFGPDGSILGTYRKLHLFDVDLADGVRFFESSTCRPGEELSVVETPLATFGLTICYDLRFPELYRALLDRGARVLCVPSAFTRDTGRDHWHVLLRARAIETQCWVIAPAQWGEHDDDGLRRSYGHSLVVDPWGCVRSDAGDEPGITFAEIDLDLQDRIRRSMPMDAHRRIGAGTLEETHGI